MRLLRLPGCCLQHLLAQHHCHDCMLCSRHTLRTTLTRLHRWCVQLYHQFVDTFTNDVNTNGSCPNPSDNDLAADPATCISPKTQVRRCPGASHMPGSESHAH